MLAVGADVVPLAGPAGGGSFGEFASAVMGALSSSLLRSAGVALKFPQALVNTSGR